MKSYFTKYPERTGREYLGMVSAPEQLSLKDRAALAYCANSSSSLPKESTNFDKRFVDGFKRYIASPLKQSFPAFNINTGPTKCEANYRDNVASAFERLLNAGIVSEEVRNFFKGEIVEEPLNREENNDTSDKQITYNSFQYLEKDNVCFHVLLSPNPEYLAMKLVEIKQSAQAIKLSDDQIALLLESFLEKNKNIDFWSTVESNAKITAKYLEIIATLENKDALLNNFIEYGIKSPVVWSIIARLYNDRSKLFTLENLNLLLQQPDTVVNKNKDVISLIVQKNIHFTQAEYRQLLNMNVSEAAYQIAELCSETYAYELLSIANLKRLQQENIGSIHQLCKKLAYADWGSLLRDNFAYITKSENLKILQNMSVEQQLNYIADHHLSATKSKSFSFFNTSEKRSEALNLAILSLKKVNQLNRDNYNIISPLREPQAIMKWVLLFSRVPKLNNPEAKKLLTNNGYWLNSNNFSDLYKKLDNFAQNNSDIITSDFVFEVLSIKRSKKNFDADYFQRVVDKYKNQQQGVASESSPLLDKNNTNQLPSEVASGSVPQIHQDEAIQIQPNAETSASDNRLRSITTNALKGASGASIIAGIAGVVIGALIAGPIGAIVFGFAGATAGGIIGMAVGAIAGLFKSKPDISSSKPAQTNEASTVADSYKSTQSPVRIGLGLSKLTQEKPNEEPKPAILPNPSVLVEQEGEPKVSSDSVLPQKDSMPINGGKGPNNNLQTDLSDDDTSTSEPRPF